MTPTTEEAVKAADRIKWTAICVLPCLESLKEDMETIRKHGKGLRPSAQRCEHLQSAELLISDLETMMGSLKTLYREETVCSSLRASAPEYVFGDLVPLTVDS